MVQLRLVFFIRLGMVEQTYKLNTWKMEAGGSGI